ncbi:MAG: DapH/DapD/GlmU-related protein [Solirubrobacterales bacterium]
MPGLKPSDRAPGLLLGEGVQLGADVELGGYVVIHAGTRVAARAVIQDHVVIGKPPILGAASTSRRDRPPPASLGEEAAVCTGAVIFAGAEIAPSAIVGDQAQVRERARIGAASVVGRGAAVDNEVTIGAGVKVESNCYLAAGTTIEDGVFVGPGVTLANDRTMSGHPSGMRREAPTLRRRCRIGAGAVIGPDVEVGEEAIVGAGAVVVASVAPRKVVVGVPARELRDVTDADLAVPRS